MQQKISLCDISFELFSFLKIQKFNFLRTTLYEASENDGLSCDVSVSKSLNATGRLPGIVHIHGGGKSQLNIP